MKMTFCGKCDSANGAAARYCRMCGTELNTQATFAAPSTPPGVEFTAHPPHKEKASRYHHVAPKKLEERGAVQNSHQDASQTATPNKQNIPPPPRPHAVTTAHLPTPQDPKASSESLRRLHAAGPLLGDTDRKKQERFDQNSAESSEGSASNKTEPAQEPPAAALKQTITQSSSAAPGAPVVKAASTKPTPPAISAKPVSPARPTPTPAPALVPSPMSRRAANQATLSSSARNSGSLSNPGPALPQGPASVLVQASGLKTQSNLSSQLLLALVGLIIVLAAGTYFLTRDRPIVPGRGPEQGRNLVRAQDQSAELMSAGGQHLERGDFVAAIDSFRGALELNPNNQAALLRLAQTQASMGQSNEALQNYQALLQRAPDHLDARLQVAELHSARSNWSAAYDEYQRIIAYDQNSPQAASALAAIEKRMPSKPAESAIAEASPLPTVITPTPLLPPPADTAPARLSLESERLASAGSIKPPTVSRSPEETPADPRGQADAHKKLGVRHINIRQYRAAINELLIALRLTPSDKDLYYLLGSSYHGLGQMALAHDYYRRVDSGPYRDVAEAGARQTEKAARKESKRRETLRNEPKNDANGKAPRTGALNDSLED